MHTCLHDMVHVDEAHCLLALHALSILSHVSTLTPLQGALAGYSKLCSTVVSYMACADMCMCAISLQH